jgi:Holliday junction DNA helicase RuvB
MSATDQTALLHLMDTGIISETKINKTRQMELTSWAFATANSYQEIIQPNSFRFLVLEIPEYSIVYTIALILLPGYHIIFFHKFKES